MVPCNLTGIGVDGVKFSPGGCYAGPTFGVGVACVGAFQSVATLAIGSHPHSVRLVGDVEENIIQAWIKRDTTPVCASIDTGNEDIAPIDAGWPIRHRGMQLKP